MAGIDMRGDGRALGPRFGVAVGWAMACLLATAGIAQGADGSPGPMRSAGADRSPGQTAASSSNDTLCHPVLEVGSQILSIDVDGSPREVIVHLPRAAGTGRLPAVVAFHGFSASATRLEATSGLSTLADAGPFIVAYPQALGFPSEWHVRGDRGDDERDLDLVRSLLPVLVEQACADPRRIILAGHSMGGAMASDAACRLADQVAGVVLVSALWFELPCHPARPVPVVALHALDDQVLPYSGGPIGGVLSGIPDQLAVESAVGAWAAHDGCGSTPAESGTGDGGAILTWPDCAAPVALHRLASGGHWWPAAASLLIAEMAATG